MASIFIEELRNLDIPEAIIQKILHHFSGQPVYIPRAYKRDLASRNAEIIQRRNHESTRELATEFKLSSQHIRRIVAR